MLGPRSETTTTAKMFGCEAPADALVRAFLFSFFPIPFVLFALLFSLPPSRNSDPGPHVWQARPPPLLPTTARALHFFFARRFELFLPSSTRVELRLPTLGPLSI